MMHFSKTSSQCDVIFDEKRGVFRIFSDRIGFLLLEEEAAQLRDDLTVALGFGGRRVQVTTAMHEGSTFADRDHIVKRFEDAGIRPPDLANGVQDEVVSKLS